MNQITGGGEGGPGASNGENENKTGIDSSADIIDELASRRGQNTEAELTDYALPGAADYARVLAQRDANMAADLSTLALQEDLIIEGLRNRYREIFEAMNPFVRQSERDKIEKEILNIIDRLASLRENILNRLNRRDIVIETSGFHQMLKTLVHLSLQHEVLLEVLRENRQM